MYNVFIDGQVGTTGLQIAERLQSRDDIELLEISTADRKNREKKKEIINSADAVILCLPDDAAKESVSLVESSKVRILDASTAHRTNPDWVYGLPEMTPEQRDLIRKSRCVSVPGCYPTGVITALKPLISAGVMPANSPITVNAVSGYSGGGRQLIEKYRQRETTEAVSELWAYRPYSLPLQHKHLPEMQKYTGLEQPPLFVPSVGHFYQGMLVMLPIPLSLTKPGTTRHTIQKLLESYYEGETFIQVLNLEGDHLEEGFLSPTACNGTNRLELMVFGNETQVVVIARLDNLGKGASGAAVQNLNILMGQEETTGLV